MIRLSKPHITNKQQLMDYFAEILDEGYFVQGRYVQAFEEGLKSYLGVKHCVAVSSGTAALHIALLAIGVGPADEVIVPAFTFPATANVIELIGAKPVLVDVDLATFNINVEAIEEKITDKTKAIMVVHLFGNPVDMHSVMSLAKRHGIKVVEDAAGALGSSYDGAKCGCIGDVGCFSFHPRKIVTTAEGGAIVTNDSEIAEKARILRNHGMVQVGYSKDFILAGFNYRMNEFEAAMGLAQVNEIAELLRERIAIASEYMQRLSNIPNLHFQQTTNKSLNSYQAFLIRLDGLANVKVIERLLRYNVESTVGAYALHMLTYYSRKYGYDESEFPIAAMLHRCTVALPFYNGMTREELDKVSEAVRMVVKDGN